MTFHFISLFPDVFEPYLSASVIGRAQKKKIITVKAHDLRRWATDKHHKADDKPFGGGPGMVLKVEPIYKGVKSIKSKVESRKGKKQKTRVILLSTRGTLLTGAVAKRLSTYDHLIFICGRYEGVDERVAEHVADEEISIGDVVLSGGELPALVVADAVARFIPGVLGTYESLEDIKGSYPTYTHPEVFFPVKKGVQGKTRGWRVPSVLLSGDHKKIDAWRKDTDGRTGK